MTRLLVTSLLIALSGCAAPLTPDGGSESAFTGKADDARQVELPELAGRYTRMRDGSLDPLDTITIHVEGERAQVQRLQGTTANTLFSSTLGDDPAIETYSVSTSGFLGGSWIERRKIVESFTRVAPDTVEYRRDMYSWVVSHRVWEDWKLYGTVIERITYGDHGITLRSIDTRYDEDDTREYVVAE